jgi:hypothetical protein
MPRKMPSKIIAATAYNATVAIRLNPNIVSPVERRVMRLIEQKNGARVEEQVQGAAEETSEQQRAN